MKKSTKKLNSSLKKYECSKADMKADKKAIKKPIKKK